MNQKVELQSSGVVSAHKVSKRARPSPINLSISLHDLACSCTAGARKIVAVSTRISLTAVYEPVENGWTQARIIELPGVITAAATGDEARELLLDALREYLLSLREPENIGLVAHDGSERESLEIVLGA
ncbi:MAG: hypothetical protein H0V51_19190 [Chloroflexi bacterium]|nr:hypothetical protein [Chloroflexota bacterium]